MYLRTRSAGFGAEVKRRIMLGTYALSAGYYDAYYGKAQQVRTLIIRDFEAAYEHFDVLLAPTAPTTAFALGRQDRRSRSPCTSTTCAPSRPTWPATRPSAFPSAPATTGCRSGSRCWRPRSVRPSCSRWPRPSRPWPRRRQAASPATDPEGAR